MAAKCYSCKFRGEVPGSAHSKCNAGNIGENFEKKNPMFGLMMAMSGGKAPGLRHDKVQFSRQGIEGGWAAWPFNFDPVWLEKCELYESKKKKVKS